MKELSVFNNQDFRRVRIISQTGEAWFVAKDVCDVLGYKDTVSAIKQHCKGVAKHHPLQTAGGIQDSRIINESDLYRLIFSSKLPAAQKFEAWVTEEVLPTIRKTGTYQTPVTKPATLLPIDKEFRAAMRMAKAMGLKGNYAVLSADGLTQRLTGSSPMQLLGVTHLVNEAQELNLTATQVAREVGIKSPNAVNDFLLKHGFQTKIGKDWSATQKGKKYSVLVDTGKARSDGTPVQQLKWKESIIGAVNNIIGLES